MKNEHLAMFVNAIGVLSYAAVVFREHLGIQTNDLIFLGTSAILTISLGSFLLILNSIESKVE